MISKLDGTPLVKREDSILHIILYVVCFSLGKLIRYQFIYKLFQLQGHENTHKAKYNISAERTYICLLFLRILNHEDHDLLIVYIVPKTL